MTCVYVERVDSTCQCLRHITVGGVYISVVRNTAFFILLRILEPHVLLKPHASARGRSEGFDLVSHFLLLVFFLSLLIARGFVAFPCPSIVVLSEKELDTLSLGDEHWVYIYMDQTEREKERV